MTPEDHDVLVSFVSHVPQLAASTLMDVATTHEAQHRALLRLAAGGFRDMTRIAASQPTIWLDILTSNRDAVLGALDAYLAGLQHARDLVAAGDRDALRGAARPGARRRAGTCPWGSRWRRSSSSCASRCPTARACSPR